MSTQVSDRTAAAAELERVERLWREIPLEYLEHHGVMPIGREGERTVIATWRDAIDDQTLDDLRLLANGEPVIVRAPESALRQALRRAYDDEVAGEGRLLARGASDERPDEDADIPLDDLVSLANEAPVVRLVNKLLLDALEARASDVHLEGYARTLRVRYRIDGMLRDVPAPPVHLMPAVVSRIKIMADLDIAERRVPQDGRIRLRLLERQVDVRVSTLPTLHGESVVLRLLDAGGGRVGLEELGMSTDTLERVLGAITRPHGIVLVTGPTGSGKTTTLYAAVDRIRTGREKILTVEDPVEYQLEGVPQVQVNEKAGVTFATALRALLRQDPDVLLVGEIRDGETAEIASQAALTGHLVLSTLHTNDAPSALTRLLDLGIAPFLVASTVEAVVAQRLVRTICVHCARQVPAPPLLAHLAEHVVEGAGCDHCLGTGFRGRTGVYEVLMVDDEIRAELQRRRGSAEIRRLAIERGMRALYDDGLRQVLAGRTTIAEVLRVSRG